MKNNLPKFNAPPPPPENPTNKILVLLRNLTAQEQIEVLDAVLRQITKDFVEGFLNAEILETEKRNALTEFLNINPGFKKLAQEIEENNKKLK